MKTKLSLTPLSIGLLIAAVLVVTTVVNLVRKTHNASRSPSATRVVASGVTETSPAVYRVAAQFVCTCGACGEKPLESCDCPTAVEERGFIQQQLASGRTEAQAAAAVEAKYDGRKTLNPDQIASLFSENAPTSGRLATSADRTHIITHFKCPCGQCSMDELKDCDCSHPSGAQEVKQFIDSTIAHNQHTVGEIIALVEQRYGGRIR